MTSAAPPSSSMTMETEADADEAASPTAATAETATPAAYRAAARSGSAPAAHSGPPCCSAGVSSERSNAPNCVGAVAELISLSAVSMATGLRAIRQRCFPTNRNIAPGSRAEVLQLPFPANSRYVMLAPDSPAYSEPAAAGCRRLHPAAPPAPREKARPASLRTRCSASPARARGCRDRSASSATGCQAAGGEGNDGAEGRRPHARQVGDRGGAGIGNLPMIGSVGPPADPQWALRGEVAALNSSSGTSIGFRISEPPWGMFYRTQPRQASGIIRLCREIRRMQD